MTQSTLPTIDIDALLAGQWSHYRALLALCYPRLANDGGPTLDESALLTHLERAEGELLANLPPAQSLTASYYSILAFSDQLFELYLHNCQLHAAIKTQLAQLRPALARAMLQQTLPWQQQALSTVFTTLYSGALGWQHDLGRAGQRYLERLTALVDEHKSNTPDHLVAALISLNNGETSRIAKLESRLCDAQIGQLHAKHAQQLCTKTLNQQMAGKQFPAAITAFLQGPWSESMRLTVVGEGRESEQWRLISHLTEILIATFQPQDPAAENQRQQTINAISEVSEQLRDVAIGLHHRMDIDQQLALVEQQHLLILKNQPLHYSPFELIDNTDPLLTAAASISKTLLNRVFELKEGQWFINHARHGDQRIKLCLKIPAAKQLLFTNFLGIKVVEKSFEEFAFLLSSKIVSTIDDCDPLLASGEQITRTLFAHYRLQIEQVSAAAEEKHLIEQQQQAREIERKKALSAAVANRQTRFAAPKLKAITEPIAPPVAKPSTVLPAASAVAVDTAPATSAELHVGASVDFGAGDETRQRCRLAAIIKSSMLHIFVDRSGIKQYSLLAAALDQQFANGSAQLIDRGSSFEGTLEKVVNSLRHRRSL